MPLSQFSCQVLRKDKDTEKENKKKKGKLKEGSVCTGFIVPQTANIRNGFEFNLKTEVSGANAIPPAI